MTDTEKEKFRQIGIDLINEYRVQRGLRPIDWLAIDTPETNAFIRSIQLHEKTKQELQGVKQELTDFRQEVSDALLSDGVFPTGHKLSRFIIPAPKPDPLVEALDSLGLRKADEWAGDIRKALAARGLEIREKSDD